MLKIKNKFIIFIIFSILLIVGFGIFKSFFSTNIDRNSYIVLVKGNVTLNDNNLFLKQREKLNIGDTVKTIGIDSIGVLEWGDGSVTRLGGNSSIVIKELYVSDDLGKLNIVFELLKGKSWSNVLSFLGEGSYFKESFRDSEAAVRGTIFNLDLDKNYLNVLNHSVIVKNDNKEIIVKKDKPLDIVKFDFILIKNFLKSVKDKDWENINKSFDIELFKGLKEQIHKDLDKLSNNAEKTYNELLLDYQKLNFVDSNDIELFKAKLNLKKKLINLSEGEQKEQLLNSTLFDFKDSIDNRNVDGINSLLPILVENKELLGEIDFTEYFNVIPDDLKDIFSRNFDNLKKLFGNSLPDIQYLDIDFSDIKNKAINLKENASNLIGEGLDTLFNK